LSELLSWRPIQQFLPAVFRKIRVEGLAMVLRMTLFQVLQVCKFLLILHILLEGQRTHTVILPIWHEVGGGVPHWVVQAL